jgi:hypothetical protein
VERRTLTIESKYCENWTIKDALREVIQNAIDASPNRVTICNEGKYQVVSDSGAGIKLSDFIIGRSSKRGNENSIGQFGEGVKIGCLVLARNNREVHIESQGKRYSFSFQFDNAWQENLLTVDMTDKATGTGTSVYIECTQEEMNEARALFLTFNNYPILETLSKGIEKTDIIENPGMIWVKGVAVTKITSVFGYNFNQKTLVNRDRGAIGYSAVCSCVADAMSYITNQHLIRRLIKEGQNEGSEKKAEFGVSFTPRRNSWKRAFRELHGARVCLSSHIPKVDLRASEKNWVVLDFQWSFWNSLRHILPSASDVVKDKLKHIPINKLEAEDRKFLNEVVCETERLAQSLGLKTYPVKVFVDTEDRGNGARFKQEGYFGGGVVGISLDTVKEKDTQKTQGILVHEYVHGTGNNSDNTREFENDLTNVIATLITMLKIARKQRDVALANVPSILRNKLK